MIEIHIAGVIGIAIGTLLIGAVIGFFVSRKVFARYLKKNPPINENMIREMFKQMGRTPSEKQIRQVMAAVNSQQNEVK